MSSDSGEGFFRQHLHRDTNQAATAGLVPGNAEAFQDDDTLFSRGGDESSRSPGRASAYDGHVPNFGRLEHILRVADHCLARRSRLRGTLLATSAGHATLLPMADDVAYQQVAQVTLIHLGRQAERADQRLDSPQLTAVRLLGGKEPGHRLAVGLERLAGMDIGRRESGRGEQVIQMGAQPGAAGLVRLSLPYAKYIRGDLIQGAWPRYRAVAGEITIERAVRGKPEADRGAQGVQVGAVIGGGLQDVRLGGEPFAHLAMAQKAIGRAIQCACDHGVYSRHGGAPFLVGQPSMQSASAIA